MRGCLYQRECGPAAGHVACSPLEVDAVENRLNIASLDHPHCLTSRHLEDFLASDAVGELELEVAAVTSIEDGLAGLKEGELDLFALPGSLLHGRMMEVLSAGCQVVGARTPRRPARFLVSENNVWHQPKGGIVLCEERIVRRQLRRARRGLRVLSPTAFAGIYELGEIPTDSADLASWMEERRQNGEIDGFVTSREVYDSKFRRERRHVLGVDPEKRGDDRYLPVPYSDLVVMIARNGFPRRLIETFSEREGETVWWVHENLIGSLSADELDRVALLVRHRQVGAIMRLAEENFDLAMENTFHNPEGEMLHSDVHVEIRLELISDNGWHTLSAERIVSLLKIESATVALSHDWNKMLESVGSELPEHPREGPATDAWIDLQE